MGDSHLTRKESVFDARLTDGSDLVGFFSKGIVVTQSQFFRRSEVFREIEQRLLPQLVNNREPLYGWSAGCSDGREVYSLAFVIQKFSEERGLKGRWDYQILGSDINRQQIARAEEGVFDTTHIERQRLASYRAYFEYINEEKIAIAPAIRAHTAFVNENIGENQRVKRFHLILCHNVLVYYDIPHRLQIINRLIQALHPRGFIFLDAIGRSSLKRIGLVKPDPHGLAYQLTTNSFHEVIDGTVCSTTY